MSFSIKIFAYARTGNDCSLARPRTTDDSLKIWQFLMHTFEGKSNFRRTNPLFFKFIGFFVAFLRPKNSLPKKKNFFYFMYQKDKFSLKKEISYPKARANFLYSYFTQMSKKNKAAALLRVRARYKKIFRGKISLICSLQKSGFWKGKLTWLFP